VEALDQRFRLQVGLRVESLVRVAVAAEKVFQPKYVAAIGSADDHRTAGSRLKQADTAQDQRAA